MNPSRQRDTSDCPAIGFSPSPAVVECCGAVSVRLSLKQKMNNKRDVGGNKNLFLPGSRDSILEVFRNGSVKYRLSLPEQLRGSTNMFSSILLLPEVTSFTSTIVIHPVSLFHCCFTFVCQREELWSVCVDSVEVCIWHLKDTSRPFHRVTLPDCIGCYCIIKVKKQVRMHH